MISWEAGVRSVLSLGDIGREEDRTRLINSFQRRHKQMSLLLSAFHEAYHAQIYTTHRHTERDTCMHTFIHI